MCACAAEMPTEPVLRDSDTSGECVCVDSSMVSSRSGGGLGSRKSIKPPRFRVDASELFRSSSGVLAKRDHQELLRRIGSLGGGLRSRIEDGLGDRGGPLRVELDPACGSEEVLWEDEDFEREFCDACSNSGDRGTKSTLGGSVVRSAVGRSSDMFSSGSPER